MNNNEVIVGTTPTIRATNFRSINPLGLVDASMTIGRHGVKMLKKTLSGAFSVTAENIDWTLTQQETLDIGEGNAQVQFNYLTSDGMRYATKKHDLMFIGNMEEGVMTSE